MPLVRIDLIRGRTEQQIRAIADTIHNAIVDVLAIPERDRFQVITEHEASRIIAGDAGLGFDRSDALVMIHISTQGGRSPSTKQHLYATLAHRLAEHGITGNDVFVSITENTAADWSFGHGRAPYLTGDLTVPTSDAGSQPDTPSVTQR